MTTARAQQISLADTPSTTLCLDAFAAHTYAALTN
jgi:hypothetical protein